MLKTLAIVSGIVGGGCLAAVQFRVAGFRQLTPFSPETRKDLDPTSTWLAVIGLVGFVLFSVLAAAAAFTP